MGSADESAVLVPAWLLRSIMLADCQAGGPTLLILRARSYGISRDRLLEIIEQKELLLDLGHTASDVICLLVEPEDDWLRSTADVLVLREYWRLLYQARIQAAVKANLAPAQAPYADGAACLAVLPRIERLGWSIFNDARFVLLRDRLVPPGADDAEVYARFAATFLDLKSFAPGLLPRFFASVDDPEQVAKALGADIDADALLRRTKPAGAADALRQEEPPAGLDTDLQIPVEPPAEGQSTRLERSADRQASAGNDIHAAILHQKASRRLHGRSLEREALANPYFARFVERLVTALRSDTAAPDDSCLQAATARYPLGSEWAAALAPVLARSADSWRNAESRLLYDLQKVCADSERGIYTLNALGWLLSLGRRPLRRRVPAQEIVQTCKHLRVAVSRLDKCQLAQAQQLHLEHLLRAALRQAEAHLRDRLQPAVSDALQQSGLHPRHMVEHVAREKLVEEFLDGIVQRGFARMGDLRDTLSRNQLKLHDLTGLFAFLRGDQLLQIDRCLAGPLDGVYHAGEAYLRLFQRVSSLLFATPIGRVFTYYCLIPFGGAFLILEVLGHTVGKIYARMAGTPILFDDPTTAEGLLATTSLGLFLLAMVNVELFRRGVVQLLLRIRNLIRSVVTWSGWRVLGRLVEAVMASPMWRTLVRYGLKPAAVTLLAWRLMPTNVPRTAGVPVLAGVYCAAAVLLNSRTFRMATHVLAHLGVVLWTRLVSDLFTGLYRAVVLVFRVLLERLERTLYAVDEWFRFRGGQGRTLLIVKASLGAVWGVIAYCVRFCVTLLAEPQINPIKHFPVVTVSHKIILPTVPSIARALESLGLGKVQAGTYATSIAFLTPGVFGFLAWELKENWRLYAANRSAILRPVRMGSHGETLAQLLRPGIHSGTIPRMFARLRRAGMEDPTRRSAASLRRQQDSLNHAGESVHHFLRREFAGLLNRHPAWRATPISVGTVELAATRIHASLECPSRGRAARLSFEQHDGWIVAGIDDPGWMLEVSPAESRLLALALLGLYQISGVDLVREQIESLPAVQAGCWMIRNATLTVWTGPKFQGQRRYSLKEEGMSIPADPGGAGPSTEAVLGLLLHRRPMKWDCWARLWDLPPGDWGEELTRIARASASVLPAGVASLQLSSS